VVTSEALETETETA